MSNSLQQTYQIREMRLEDVRRVILIEREIFLFPWSEMNFADSIRAGYYCRVVELNDLLIGYAIMMTGPDEAHILTIGISAQWQHQGWGHGQVDGHQSFLRSEGSGCFPSPAAEILSGADIACRRRWVRHREHQDHQ